MTEDMEAPNSITEPLQVQYLRKCYLLYLLTPSFQYVAIYFPVQSLLLTDTSPNGVAVAVPLMKYLSHDLKLSLIFFPS